MFKKLILAVALSLAACTSIAFAHNDLNTICPEEQISNDSLEDTEIAALYSSLTNNAELYLTDYYSTYYFSNLSENYGRNVKGSCTYGALGMLLSFYDTYWDDSFVPENYDMITTLSSNALSFDLESPGTYQESYSLVGGLTTAEYYQVVEQYSNFYFHLKLIQMGKEHFGQYKFDNPSQPCALTYSELYDLTSYYLYTYLGKSSSDVEIVSSVTAGVSAKNFTISMVEQGIPVILRMGHLNRTGGHAMIAYDYDEDNDDIYVHAGWGSDSTHVTLDDIDYDDYWDALAIVPHSNHSHSNNFKYSNGYQEIETHCSCNFVIPYNIDILDGNYRDTIPVFKWYCLNHEKWFINQNLKYHFSLLNSNRIELFTVDVDGDEYRLTQSQWDLALSLNNRKYYAYVEPFSSVYPYWDDYAYSELFAQSQDFKWATVIEPTDYDFADAYPTDTSTQTNYINHYVDGLSFSTRRYRTGYIHDEYIVMSCIRNNINSAWIEYVFVDPIIRLDVELSYWRSVSYEHLSSSNGNATLDAKINGAWSMQLDLLSSSTNLPTDRNYPTWYTIEFEQPIYEIRFNCNTTYVSNNENNRGRICIGNLAIWNYLPLSETELDYVPEDWNNLEMDDYNCYAYALNTKNHGFMQPGQSENHVWWNTTNYFDETVLLNMVSLDAYHYNFAFEPVGKYEQCKPGFYKVALVVDPNYPDYHWYRQNSDGTWSHKPGGTEVTNKDGSDLIIIDPETCDRSNAEAGLNYTLFYGFFQVNINGMI